MPSRTMAGLDETLQTLIDSAERGEWDQLGQIAEKLIPTLTAVSEDVSAEPADAVEITELLRKLQIALNRCTERQTQISPLLEALSKKTPELP